MKSVQLHLINITDEILDFFFKRLLFAAFLLYVKPCFLNLTLQIAPDLETDYRIRRFKDLLCQATQPTNQF